MKYNITALIIFITISLNGQWSNTFSHDIKCVHAKTENDNFLFKLGFTAKIRDAEIRIESADQSASTTNTGFVPLLSFELRWIPAGDFTVLLDGDALVGPVGRAEDVFLGAELPLSQRISARAGYRIVEGGADVESVYNFTLVNYVTAGLTLRL